jgi:hypothetical protein
MMAGAGAISEGIRKEANNSSKRVLVEIGATAKCGEGRKLPIQLPNKLYRVMSFSDIKNGDTLQVRLVIKFEATGLIPEKWTVEKCSSAQVKGAEGNEEKSVQ